MKLSVKNHLGLIASVIATSLSAQTTQKSLLELEYGTYFEGTGGSLFTSADQTKFNVSTNIGLLLIGYFNTTYNIEQEAKNWGAPTFKQDMLNNFNVLSSGSDWSTGADGYQLSMGDIVDYNNPLGQGGEVKAYLMTISGVTKFDEAYAEDIKGLAFTTIPNGHMYPMVDSFLWSSQLKPAISMITQATTVELATIASSSAQNSQAKDLDLVMPMPLS